MSAARPPRPLHPSAGFPGAPRAFAWPPHCLPPEHTHSANPSAARLLALMLTSSAHPRSSLARASSSASSSTAPAGRRWESWSSPLPWRIRRAGFHPGHHQTGRQRVQSAGILVQKPAPCDQRPRRNDQEPFPSDQEPPGASRKAASASRNGRIASRRGPGVDQRGGRNRPEGFRRSTRRQNRPEFCSGTPAWSPNRPGRFRPQPADSLPMPRRALENGGFDVPCFALCQLEHFVQFEKQGFCG